LKYEALGVPVKVKIGRNAGVGQIDDKIHMMTGKGASCSSYSKTQT